MDGLKVLRSAVVERCYDEFKSHMPMRILEWSQDLSQRLFSSCLTMADEVKIQLDFCFFRQMEDCVAKNLELRFEILIDIFKQKKNLERLILFV